MSPLKPARPCRYQECPALTTDKGGYCERHLKQTRDQYDKERGTASARGYDSNWWRARKLYLSEHPLCEDCENQGLVVIAQMVHHKDGNPRNNDPANYRALCNTCHERVTGSRFGG